MVYTVAFTVDKNTQNNVNAFIEIHENKIQSQKTKELKHYIQIVQQSIKIKCVSLSVTEY